MKLLLTTLGIEEDYIEKLAYECEHYKRKPKKISATNQVFAFLDNATKDTISFTTIAAAIDELTGELPSKQGVHKRMTKGFVSILKMLLKKFISAKISNKIPDYFKLDGYARVIIQDSTIEMLPQKLFHIFSGVKNAHKSVCNVRIQYAFDLINLNLVHISIDPYSKNDLAVASELEIKEGDLLLRDRGYLSLSEIKRCMKNKCHYILRHKANLIYKDCQNENPIELLNLLRSEGDLDMYVYLNDNSKTKVRLLAQKVPKSVSDLRKSKAKKELKRKKGLSKEYLELLEWSVYITNIPLVSFKNIELLYTLRWRVENMFKVWKSNLKLDMIHNVSKEQLEALIYSKIIMATVTLKFIYIPYKLQLEPHHKTVSMHKLFTHISLRISSIVKYIKGAIRGLQGLYTRELEFIKAYCTYDKRKRENFTEKIREVEKAFKAEEVGIIN